MFDKVRAYQNYVFLLENGAYRVAQDEQPRSISAIGEVGKF